MLPRIGIICFFLQTGFVAFAHTSTCKQCNILFTENKNQWDKRIRYALELPAGRMLLENNAFTFDFRDRDALENIHKKIKSRNPRLSLEERIIRCHAYQVRFLNSNAAVQLQPHEPLPGYRNYFLGKNKSKWASKVQDYGQVIYKDLYVGIDMNVYGQNGSFKYDFIVQPGADAASVQLQYSGVENILFSENGDLVIKTSVNEIIEQRPFAYQLVDGNKKEVKCRFVLKKADSFSGYGKFTVSFDFPQGYDKSSLLIIDPVLIFSTFSGSTADNWGFTGTYDLKENAYSGGIVFNVDAIQYYPVSLGAYQTVWGGGVIDMAIIKYDTNGVNRLFATYLGGSNNEMPHSLVVNQNNELLIYGTTGSADFPVTPGAYDTSFNGGSTVGINAGSYDNGSDIVISRLSEDGSQLLASTYVGGSGNDGLNAVSFLQFNYGDEARGEIITDKNNNCYVASSTQSQDFPVTIGAFQNLFGGGTQDGCVFKMDNNLSTLIWSSFLGGNGDDGAYSLHPDRDENVYVAGGTRSANFPATAGSYRQNYAGGDADGFVTHISKNGESILHSTFFGSDRYDQCYFVQLDNEQHVYLFGQTQAPGSTLVYNAAFSNPNSGQFISKLGHELDTLIFSTVFGTGSGNPEISPTAFLVDVCDKIYVSGWATASVTTMPVTADALKPASDGRDFYLMVMEQDVSAIRYATYFGVDGGVFDHVDGGTSRFNKKGIIYQSVCGDCGGSQDTSVTTPGVWSRTNQSTNCNNLLFKLYFDYPVLNAGFTAAPLIGCVPLTVDFTNKSTYGISYLWDFGDGNTATSPNPSHTFTSPGIYNVRLVVADTVTCNPYDTIYKQIQVIGNNAYSLPPDSICSGGNIQIGLSSGFDTAFTYRWTPSVGLSDTTIANPVASPVVTTEYTLLVSNGLCTDTVRQMVFVNTINAGTDTSVCKGGSLQIGMIPEANVIYLWSPSEGLSDTTVANPVASPDTTSRYILKMQTGNCIRYDTVNINVIFDSFYAAPSLSACKGMSVQLGVNPGGITSFQWVPVTGLSDSAITNPVALAGSNISYTLYISNGVCNDTIIQDITVYAADAGTDTAICSGSTVKIGGAPQPGAYYFWTPSSFLSDPTSSNPDAFPPGDRTYILQVSNGSCNIYDTVNVVVLNNTTSDLGAYFLCDGDSVQIGIPFSGNIGLQWIPTTHLSDTALTNPVCTSDTTINYVLYLWNTTGCTDTLLQEVRVNAANAGRDTTICRGQSVPLGGSAQVGVNWYWWTPNTFLSGQWGAMTVSTPDSSITYTILMSMSNCQRTDTVRVGVVLDSSYSVPALSACLGDTIQIGLIPAGIDSAVWIPSTGLSDSNIINPYMVADTDITYKFYHYSADKVCVDTIQQSIDVTAVYVNAGTDTSICRGDSVLIGVASQGFTYTWTPAYGLSSTSVSNPVASPDSSVTYIVTASEKNCLEKDTVNVSIIPISIYPGTDTVICFGDTVQIGFADSMQAYLWAPANTLSDSVISNPFAFPKQSTTYYLTVFNARCTLSDSVNVSVEDSLASGFDMDIQLGCEGIEVRFLNQSLNASGYYWDFGDGDTAITANPVHTYTDNMPHEVMLTVMNNNSRCSETASKTIYPYEEYVRTKIPNVFTPNHDGQNDCFRLAEVALPRGCYEITIYNRWGEMVFESGNPSLCWDGTSKETGEEAAEGVYFYIFKIRKLTFTGFVTVIR